MTMKNEYISRRIDACGTVVFSKNDSSKTHLDIAGRFIKDLFTSFIRRCIPSFDNEYGYVQMPYLFSERQLDSVLLPALYDLCDGHVIAELPVVRYDADGAESHGRIDYWCMYDGYSMYIEVKHVYQTMKAIESVDNDGRLQKCWDTMNGYQMRSLSDELKHSYEKRKGIIRLALEFVALKDGSTFKEEECGMEGVPLSDLDTLSSMVSPSPTHVAAWYVGKDIAEAAAEHQGKFCPVLAVLAKSYPTLK